MRKPLPSNDPPVINSAHFHGELLSIRYLETQLCSRQTRRPSPLRSMSCSVCNVSSTHRHMARLVAQTGFLGGDGVLAESWKGGSYLGTLFKWSPGGTFYCHPRTLPSPYTPQPHTRRCQSLSHLGSKPRSDLDASLSLQTLCRPHTPSTHIPKPTLSVTLAIVWSKVSPPHASRLPCLPSRSSTTHSPTTTHLVQF